MKTAPRHREARVVGGPHAAVVVDGLGVGASVSTPFTSGLSPDSLGGTLWRKLLGDPPASGEEAELAVNALARCAERASIDTNLQAAVRETLDEPFTSDDVVASQETALQHARRLAQAGVLGRSALASIELSAVAQTLEVVMEGIPATQRTEVDDALLARLREASPLGTAEQLRRVLEAAAGATFPISDW